jgi:hypothetical protein
VTVSDGFPGLAGDGDDGGLRFVGWTLSPILGCPAAGKPAKEREARFALIKKAFGVRRGLDKANSDLSCVINPNFKSNRGPKSDRGLVRVS